MVSGPYECFFSSVSVWVGVLQTAYTRGLLRHVLTRTLKQGKLETRFHVPGEFDFRLSPPPPTHTNI
jgi:hypothetical protein